MLLKISIGYCKSAMLTGSLILLSNSLYSQLWKKYQDSAIVYNNTKNTVRAIEFYLKSKDELKKDSLGTDSYAAACDSLGILLSNNNQLKEAAENYIEAIQLQKKLLGDKHAGYIYSCEGLGVLYISMDQYEKAVQLLLEVKQLKEKLSGKEDPGYATSCTNLGRAYFYLKQYEKAEQLFLETKKIREKLLGKQHPDYAQSCYKLAVFYHNTEQYGKATALYLEAKKILETVFGKEYPDYINCCINLSRTYIETREFEKAAPLLNEIKQTQERIFGKEDADYASTCNDLAYIYSDMGHYEKAEPLCMEAKQVREKLFGKQDPEYIRSCISLAVLYRNMGQYQKAVSQFNDVKQVQEKLSGKDNQEYARSCNNLSAVYLLLEQYGEAEALCLEAKKIEEKLVGNQDPLYADCCTNLAAIYLEMKLYKKAAPLFIEAKNIKEKVLGKEHPGYATCCDNLAELNCIMGKYGEAELLYITAKKIREMKLGREHPDYAASCQNLGTLYRLVHQPLKAEKEFRESFDVNVHNLDAIFQFTNEKEKNAFIKNISGEDDEAYSFYASEKITSGHPYSLSLFHRNLILSSSQALQKEMFAVNDTSMVNKYNEWTALKKNLSVLYSSTDNESRKEINTIEEKAGLLEKELARNSETFKKQQEKPDWKNLQNKLHTDEAAIEFAAFHFHNGRFLTDSVLYIALIIRKDKLLPVLVSLFNEKKLKDLLTASGNKTTNDAISELYASRGIIVKGNNNAEVNKSVYSLVWKPLEKELKGIKTVYFAPAGLLHRIAFAALPVNKNEVLSDKYKLVQLATTASVTDQTQTFISSSDKLQLYGGINYDADSTSLKKSIQQYAANTQQENARSIPADLTRSGTFTYLAGTASEINTIEEEAKSTKLHATLSSGINATEESFKALNGKASPAVLHIATHGFFFPDPKTAFEKKIQPISETGQVFRQSDNPLFRSGLLFAGANNAWQGKPVDGMEDGILTAYEVSNMYLPNTKLAVLSACETALGDIQGSEGVYGLQRAFKIAAVQNLVMSLWKVPDAETAEFMQLFYKNMFAKQSISDAFYNAQTKMKNKYRSEPYKWAAWILVR